MQTYNKQSHLIYLRAQAVAEYAHEIHVLKCCTDDPLDAQYAENRLKEAYRELQNAITDAGLI